MAFIGGKDSKSSDNKLKDLPKVGTILGGNTHFVGNFKSGSDTIRIEGTFDGDIETEGDIVVVDGASVTGNVKAKNMVVSGHVNGNVDANGCLEITRTGVVVATVSVAKLVIDEGACFNGQSSMKSTPVEEIKSLPAGSATILDKVEKN